jgi:hypothetical protein
VGNTFSEFGIQSDYRATRFCLKGDDGRNFLRIVEWTGPPWHTVSEFLKFGNPIYMGMLQAGSFPAGTVLVVMEEEVPPQGEKL